MYDLSLDNSTIFLWRVMFLFVLALLGVSLVALWVAAWRKKHKLLGLVAATILVCAGAGLYHTTLSPFSYYRKKIEPSVTIGEELFRRYSDFEAEHGRYPLTIDEVYFQELDIFDVVAGVRRDLTGCDGAGEGCRVIDARLSPEGLVVYVSHGLIQCNITNLERQWHCRDQR